MMKRTILAKIALMVLVVLASCGDFLDQEPDNILPDDKVFKNPALINSTLANFYGRTYWWNGEDIRDNYSFMIMDDAGLFDGGPNYRSTFEDDRWRVYDYTLIRHINVFLQGLRETPHVKDNDKEQYEGEVRFIRAWCYFNMCRSLGGVPLLEDEVFKYVAGTDIEPLQKPRATESETYDYIIKECREIAELLSEQKQKNNARANKWTAKMLEARAALYAGSLAKYNNAMSSPISTQGSEVGIDASKANYYYDIALKAADEVIGSGVYILQDRHPANKGRNFYEATTVKEGNTEVIWAFDYVYPGSTQNFTLSNIPHSHVEDVGGSIIGPVLNLVEQFEPIHTDTPGEMSKIVTQENGTYKFYDSPERPFEDRDPRLWGTVIYPGAEFKGKVVELQAGQLNKNVNGEWVLRVGALGSKDENEKVITSMNGPKEESSQFLNKSGFYFRKFLDETPGASTRDRGSDTWMPRFRMSEAYLIAGEASFELNNGLALGYINNVRERAGVKPLTILSLEKIIHERRVEFAFEDHRYWDMRRFRLAEKLWDGDNQSEIARQRQLWPYLVVAPGDPQDGKWVFIESYFFMSPNARYFRRQNYYAFFDQSWLNNNPKLVKNPYQ